MNIFVLKFQQYMVGNHAKMSADNGIYILMTPSSKSGEIFEYRVIEAQAIDNIFYENPEGNPEQIISYFGKCIVYYSSDQAQFAAEALYAKILNDDFCPYLEYGIQVIELKKTFDEFRRLAKKK